MPRNAEVISKAVQARPITSFSPFAAIGNAAAKWEASDAFLRARKGRYEYADPAAGFKLESVWRGQTSEVQQRTASQKYWTAFRASQRAMSNDAGPISVDASLRASKPPPPDEESRTYVGRSDESGAIFAKAARLFDSNVNWEPSNSALIKIVNEKKRLLRSKKLHSNVVATAVRELVPTFVYTTNAWDGSIINERETREWCRLALAIDNDRFTLRAGLSTETIARDVDPDVALVSDIASVVSGSRLYRELIAASVGDMSSSRLVSELGGVLPVNRQTGVVTESVLHRVNVLVRGSQIPPTQRRNYRKKEVKIDGSILLARAEACDALMKQLIRQIQADEQSVASAFGVAAAATYRLTRIHPWTDGNGRTARFLSDLLLMRDGYVPAYFAIGNKKLYSNALEWVDRGDGQPLSDLLLEKTDTMLDAYLAAPTQD